MKRMLAILFLASVSHAEGPILGPNYDSNSTSQEFINVYKDIRSPVIDYGVASTMTISNLTVTSCAGCGVTVPINAGGQKITNVSTATVSTDAAIFTQVKILQVRQFTVTGSSSTTVSADFVPTNSTGTITPSSTSSKVLVIGSAGIENINNNSCRATVLRNGANLSSSNGLTNAKTDDDSAADPTLPTTIVYLDSPATTNNTGYAVGIKSNGVGTCAWNLGATFTATLTLMEVNGL